MIDTILKRFNLHTIKGLSEYLDVHPNSITNWIKKGSIPRKYHRRIVEYIEILNDEGLDICQKILK